ncbi:Zn-dependent protease with chaperone function [Streptoalloteichus tenebrarius]|uniref:Zn-dependent protease with chaperone function n=1 Tax=Streptoalloteichus tenebrarius (strain ATCC 17920 / DSM 40477 / JCM 4838 / CBS 697.72 / NBRC 16177 / NCIMB 11028 / NRRL B-12390 / A12253. 1 / ISP 5477) TaxID=1933 RepID=A0ABT1HZ36_STRSD|nr:M48 family metallopeptidase [Streptoalloteichus tenebrarius]MCP2260761.1 Zn-dependent protease with chaperone function [Streptoalloteichus tenebrarius]BFF03425.1 M48 family metallopeptidase [Streptoalloteichus tenebrarius]
MSESRPGNDVQAVEGRSLVRFPEISPRAYEHPADRGALATARALPGFDAILKAISGAVGERSERLLALASSVRVSERQHPRLDRLRRECAEVLDLDPVPDLFVQRDPRPNAYTIGMDQPFIVLTTGLVELLDEEALRFAVGHEMGHALSGHALYYTVLRRLVQMVTGLSWMPVGYWGMRAVIAALTDWYRRAELSADRAGLLCVQDPGAALRAHVMMAGASQADEVDTAAFLQQAAEYDAVESVWDSVLKLGHLDGLVHPLPVVRAADLQRWAAGEQYRAILTGEYPRRGEDPTSTWKQDVKDAARSYKEALSTSADPLAKVLNEVGDTLAGAASKVWQRFNGRDGRDGADGGQRDGDADRKE